MNNQKKRIRDYSAVRQLHTAWNDNPLAVIAVGAGALVAVSKVIDSLSGIQSRRAYAKMHQPRR